MAQIKLALNIITNLKALQNEDMPPPSNYTTMKQDRCIVWNIDGFFGTSDGKEYLRDVAENLSHHFKTSVKEIFYSDKHSYKGGAFKLGEFKYLKNLRVYKPKWIGLGLSTGDALFDDMRAYGYSLARAGTDDVYELVNNYGNTICDDWKKVRMKARAIQRFVYEYYVLRDYGIKKVSENSREVNAGIQTQARSDAKYAAAVEYFETLQAFNVTESMSEMATGMKVAWRTAKKYFLRWLENRVKAARNSAMIFICSIRGTATKLSTGTAAGKLIQGINMKQEKLKELLNKIRTMELGDLIDLRESIMRSEANVITKDKVLEAIRVRTHRQGDFDTQVLAVTSEANEDYE